MRYLFMITVGFLSLLPHVRSRTLASVTNASKAGLAWPNGDTIDIKQFEGTGKVSWYYTWSPYPVDSDLEFVPMFWGTQSIDTFSSTIQQTLSNRRLNVTAILGMNEPEQLGQSNLTVQQGVQLWQTYVEPYHSMGLRLGSPAPSGSPAGTAWLQGFLQACGSNCTVDFIAMHWYGTNASDFISYLQEYNSTFQKPLWITEWTCQNYVNLSAQCTQEDIIQFMNTTQSFMDSAPFVERYAWFGAMKDLQGINPLDGLLDQGGHLNALGEQYINSNMTLSSSSKPGVSTNLGMLSSSTGILAVLSLAFIETTLFLF